MAVVSAALFSRDGVVRKGTTLVPYDANTGHVPRIVNYGGVNYLLFGLFPHCASNLNPPIYRMVDTLTVAP